MNIAGMIVAAGKQTRFKSDVPKALYPFKDKTIIEYNIEILKKYVKNIYIICSFENSNYFNFLTEKYENVYLIKIISGYGCGDAVLKGLNKINEEKIIQLWGDTIHINDKLYDQIINSNEDFIVPVTFENKPYVEFIEINNKIISVTFSKYKKTQPGWHDLSIFYYDRKYVLSCLQKLNNSKQYRNNELIFLDICNLNDFNGYVLKTNEIAYSFNTIDEFLEISKIIDKG